MTHDILVRNVIPHEIGNRYSLQAKTWQVFMNSLTLLHELNYGRRRRAQTSDMMTLLSADSNCFKSFSMNSLLQSSTIRWLSPRARVRFCVCERSALKSLSLVITFKSCGLRNKQSYQIPNIEDVETLNQNIKGVEKLHIHIHFQNFAAKGANIKCVSIAETKIKVLCRI